MSFGITSSQVVKITGLKQRTIQNWANIGVLHPLPETSDKGTGVHRLYSRSEVELACILSEFAAYGISLGNMKSLASTIREILATGQRVGCETHKDGQVLLRNEHIRRLYSAEQPPNLVAKISADFQTDRLKELGHVPPNQNERPLLSDLEFQNLCAWVSLDAARKKEARITMALALDGEHWQAKFYHDGYSAGGIYAFKKSPDEDFVDERSYIVINVTKILSGIFD